VLYVAFVIVFLALWALFAAVLPRLLRGLHRLGKGGASLSMRYGIVQRVVHHASRFRDYLPVALIAIAGALLAAWAGDQFLDLAEAVHAKSAALQKIDVGVHDWAVAQRYAGATTFFDSMSTIGGPEGVGVIAAIAAIALVVTKRFRWTIYLLANVGIGGGLDLELKRYFARARPAVAQQLMHATGYSFPSGHAMGSTVLFAALSYLAIRILPRWRWKDAALSYLAIRILPRWRWKSAAIALGATLIVSVALSRVYLGVHWISDVGAGIVGGLLCVTMTTVAYETFRRIRMIRQLRLKSSIRDGARGA
jgi:undecaprenyl-diphosphatase